MIDPDALRRIRTDRGLSQRRLAAASGVDGERWCDMARLLAACARADGPDPHAALSNIERYAARFAAKEAAMKALGTGWNYGVRWRDVEVARQPGQRPTIVFHGKAAEFASRLGAQHAALSISHTAEQAIAQVILEN